MRLFGTFLVAAALGTASVLAGTAAAQSSDTAQNTVRVEGQEETVPRYVCQRVRKCRPVVRCMPYFKNPWNCYRRRSCRTVRECNPVGRGTGPYEY